MDAERNRHHGWLSATVGLDRGLWKDRKNLPREYRVKSLIEGSTKSPGAILDGRRAGPERSEE